MDKYSTTRFNKAPVIGHKRTRFDLSHDILTTFNTGEFVPILTEFINPGETVDLNYASLTRLETSLHQTMDNAYLEFAFFYTPLRILWVDFEKFEGANDDPWAQLNNYTVPQLELTAVSAAVSITPGSLLNHLMLPAGSYGSGQSNPKLTVEALSLRNVFEIYNSWYRDENYDSIVYYSKASTNLTASNAFLFNGAYIYPSSQNLYVNRLRDRFSTLLPAPQKGQEVSIGLTGMAPVIANANSGITIPSGGSVTIANSFTGPTGMPVDLPNGAFEVNGSAISLEADLGGVNAVTINQLRLAIVRQAMLERDARAGTRYVEITNSRWDVHTNSLELDRPEFLGGKRIPISMMEVLQTSETGTTVLGSDAGHSKTIDKSDGFVKSFTQHGIVQGFMYVRTARSYSQGIDRMHFIKDYLDLPDPMLDNVGEIAAKRKEMYAIKSANQTDIDSAEAVAGYQEQYYWLKERINRFSGYFQPGINGTLDSWHYGDDYSTFPLISASWLKESPNQVDRTIAVSSNAGFQWSANVHFELHVTRPFAKYSIPNTFGF
jgi:hypothetical protein